jgi:L-alanine-DL-glutamate epimerase-like enolase superfamily enzyme
VRITGIDETTVVIPSAARNANLSFAAMTASAVVVRTDQRRDGKAVVGLAFDSIGRYGHGGLARERFIPRLLAADPQDYCDAAGRLDPTRAAMVLMRDEKAGGDGERAGAVGLIDCALWDLAAKIEQKPLWRLLSECFGNGTASGRVAVYASGGHYRDDGLVGLGEEISRGIDAGHMLFKIKVGGVPLADDLNRVELVLKLIGPQRRLAVDCNGALDESDVFAYVEQLADYDLAWVEEPVEPLDYALYARVCAATVMPIATGENVFSFGEARNLLRYAALRPDRDVLQFDISLAYGISEYVRILDLAQTAGFERLRFAPHAGHLLSLNAVAGLGLGLHETALDPESLFGGYPEGMTVEAGAVQMTDAPGIGIEQHPRLYKVFSGLIGCA